MSKQHQGENDTRPNNRQRAAGSPTNKVEADQVSRTDSLDVHDATMAENHIASESQAALLGDIRIPRVQKHRLATSLGQLLGNRTLQRVTTELPGSEDPASSAAKGISGAGSSIPYQSEMERTFGQDFSDVRAHIGSEAQEALEDLGARAYTLGSHVAFGSESPDKGTVAHELTHIVQQATGSGQQTGVTTAEGSRAEREAKAVAESFAANQNVPPVSERLASSTVAGDWEDLVWALDYRDSEHLIVASLRDRQREPDVLPSTGRIERGLNLPTGCLERETQSMPASGEVAFRIRDRFIQGDALHPQIAYALVHEGLMEAVTERQRPVPEGAHGVRPADFQEQVEQLAGSQRTFTYTELMTYLDHQGRAAYLRAWYSGMEHRRSEILIEEARQLDRRLTVDNEETFRFGGAFHLREMGRILLQIYNIIDERLGAQLLDQRSEQAGAEQTGGLFPQQIEVAEDSPLGNIAMDIAPFNNIDLWTSYANIRIIPPPSWRGRRRQPPPPPPPPRPPSRRQSRPACNINIPIADIIGERDAQGIGRRYRFGESRFRVLFDYLRAAGQSGFDDRYISRQQVDLTGTFPQLLYEHRMRSQQNPARQFQTVHPEPYKGSLSMLFEQLIPSYFDQTLEIRVSGLLPGDVRATARNTAARYVGRIPSRQRRLFADGSDTEVVVDNSDYKIDFGDEILGSYQSLTEHGLDIRGRVSAITSNLNGAIRSLNNLFTPDVFAQLPPERARFFQQRARLLMANPGFEIIRLEGSGGTTLQNVIPRLFRYYAAKAKQGVWRDFRCITITNDTVIVPCDGGVRSLMRVINRSQVALDQCQQAQGYVQQQAVNRFRANEGLDYVRLRNFLNGRITNSATLDYWARRWGGTAR